MGKILTAPEMAPALPSCAHHSSQRTYPAYRTVQPASKERLLVTTFRQCVEDKIGLHPCAYRAVLTRAASGTVELGEKLPVCIARHHCRTDQITTHPATEPAVQLISISVGQQTNCGQREERTGKA